MEGDKKRKISIGVGSDMMRLCLEVAFRQGVLKKEEVEVVHTKEEKEILKGMTEGSLDMGRVAAIEAIKANAKGKPIYAVAGFDNQMVHVVLGSKSIHSPAELRNRKVGVNSLGDYTDRYMRAALKYLGFTPDKEVQVIPVGQSKERRRRLASDEIQATIVSEAPALRLKEEGFPWLVQMAYVFPNYLNKVIVSGEKALSQYPEAIKTIIKALIQGYRYLDNSENDEEVKKIIPTLNFKEPSLAMAQLSVHRGRKPSNNGSISMEGLRMVLDEAQKRGEVPSNYDLTQLLRFAPLNVAQRELGLAG